tara:strand:- start:1135 stop:1779 length:645 start_codon:yes stop_codon:yes gene_type:complete
MKFLPIYFSTTSCYFMTMEDEWDSDESDESEKFELDLTGKTNGIDNVLIRWTAMLIAQGYKSHEIRRRLSEADLDSRLTQGEYKRLMSLAQQQAEDMQDLAISKAELADTDWLRLDSYSRRRRNIARLEGIILQAHSLADNVSKLNNVSFMIGGLMKAQDALDKMSGAQDAKPQVVVNIGYDPMEQFRQVVQEELRTIDINAEEVIDSDTPESD